MTPKQEARLYGRAARERWPVPPDEMQKTIERACYLRDYAEKESTQVAAIGALVQMASQNQKDEHKFADLFIQQRNAELDAIAAELGVEVGAIEDADRQAGGSYRTIEATREPAGE